MKWWREENQEKQKLILQKINEIHKTLARLRKKEQVTNHKVETLEILQK